MILEGISAADVSFSTGWWVDTDLHIRLRGGGDIIINDFFYGDEGTTYGVDEVTFGDGTSLDRAAIEALALANPSDYHFGSSDPDIINLGTGNDYAYGDAGHDTYVYTRGDGHDASRIGSTRPRASPARSGCTA